MSVLTNTTPSTSVEGGAVLQGVPQLPETVVEVTDWKEIMRGSGRG